MDLQTIRVALQQPPIEDNDYLNQLLDMAKAYVGKYARVDDVTSLTGYNGKLADAVLLWLVIHWYTNRQAVVTGTIATELPFALQSALSLLHTGEELI